MIFFKFYERLNKIIIKIPLLNKKIMCGLYQSFYILKDWDGLTDEEKNNVKKISEDMSDVTAQVP